MKFSKYFLVAFIANFTNTAIAENLSEIQQKELISSLNYLQYSTARIKMSENKAVAEDIYYSIINELKIEAISNRELNFEYGEFLAKCANLKLTQNEKDFIKQLNEKSQKNAYLSAFSNMGSVFYPGQSPHQLVASIIYTSVANGFAVANTKNQLKTQLEKDMFYLDQDIMRDIYAMQTTLFTTSAKLLSNSSSTGRINENSMNIFMNAIKLESAKERKNALCEPQLQKNMAMFPPYWFELGNAYQELGEYNNAIKAYDSFISIKENDIVVKDKNYVTLLKNRIQILLGNNPAKVTENTEKYKTEILNYIDILKSNYLDSEAGEKNSYLAKIYYLIGEYDKALECLNYIVESKSTYPDLIEEAVNLKLLLNSTQNTQTAALYQESYNFSKIKFGNADIDYSKLPQKEGWFMRMIHAIGRFFANLFSSSNEEPDVVKIDSDYLCFEMPNNLISQFDLTVGIDDKLYCPHYIKNDSTNTSIVFIEYEYDEIEEDSNVSFFFKSKQTHQDIIVKYSMTSVKTKYVKAADKGYKRIGSDIFAHNAQTSVEFGKAVVDYDYVIDDEEDAQEDVREDAEELGAEKGWTQEEINSEITKGLTSKLAPDQKFLQERMTASEKAHYKNDKILYSPNLVTYDDDYYLIGISSIYDSKIDKEFTINSSGNIEFFTSKNNTNTAKIEDLSKTALAGDINSMITLGIAYIEGYDTPKNPKEGVRWLLAAVNSDKKVIENSKMNIAQACKYLGECYWNGNGVNKDKKQARKWFSKSKEYGFDIDEKYLD